MINGDAGEDEVLLEGTQADYKFLGRANKLTVKGNGFGVDSLSNIEFLQFEETLVATTDLF